MNNSFIFQFNAFSHSLGEAIKRITCVEYDTSGKPICVSDRQSMVQAARGLLSAVTRVLLLADMVVVKQIIHIKKKVRFRWEMFMERMRVVFVGGGDIESIGNGHVIFGICEIIWRVWQSDGGISTSYW